MKVKRPAFLFLSSEVLGILLATGLVSDRFLLILFLIAIFLYLKIFFEGKLYFKTILVILIVGILGFVRFKTVQKVFDTYVSNIEILGKGNKIVVGKVENIGKSTNSNYFILSNCESSGLELGMCRCYFSDELGKNVKIGNSIKINAGLQVLNEPTNEGEFNQKLFYRSDDITFMAYANDIEITNDRCDNLRQKIYETKLIVNNQINKIFEEKDAGLFQAMITGDKSNIDKLQRKKFSDNGIAHILAISGLHLSILGLAFFELLRKKLRVNTAALIVTIFISLYGILIDASAASMRAIIMLFVRFLSLSVGRTYDSKNTLYITAFIFIMLRPYLLFNAGFQFSYVAIFALNHKVVIGKSKPIGEKLRKQTFVGDKFREPLRVPAVIILTLFLFPITIYHYFTYPLYSILLNLIVIPLMSFVLFSGLAALGVSFLSLSLGKIFAFAVHVIFFIYDKLCEFVETLPLHLLSIGRPTVYEVLYYYVAIFLIIFALKGIVLKERYKNLIPVEKSNRVNKCDKIIFLSNFIKIILCLMLFSLSLLIISVRLKDELRMTFISIGQGDSIIVESNNLILSIDGGSTSNKSNGQYILSPHLKSRAIGHIDYAYVTHADSDHTNGIIYLLENDDEIKIKNLVLPITAMDDTKFDKLKTSAKSANVNISYMKEEDIKVFNNYLALYVLNPNEDSLKAKKIDQNDMSLTFKLKYREHSALFTGDIGKTSIERMLKDSYALSHLDVDVLKVPHHGSKNSNVLEFYEIISPQYSVFSYGKNNNYGHPSGDTIDSALNVGSKILKTGESGQIDIYFGGESITTYTFLDDKKDRLIK